MAIVGFTILAFAAFTSYRSFQEPTHTCVVTKLLFQSLPDIASSMPKFQLSQMATHTQDAQVSLRTIGMDHMFYSSFYHTDTFMGGVRTRLEIENKIPTYNGSGTFLEKADRRGGTHERFWEGSFSVSIFWAD
jgi:hypothetical protein